MYEKFIIFQNINVPLCKQRCCMLNLCGKSLTNRAAATFSARLHLSQVRKGGTRAEENYHAIIQRDNGGVDLRRVRPRSKILPHNCPRLIIKCRCCCCFLCFSHSLRRTLEWQRRQCALYSVARFMVICVFWFLLAFITICDNYTVFDKLRYSKPYFIIIIVSQEFKKR